MMSDVEVRDALQKLSDRVGQLETEVRVVKHDLNNNTQASQGLGNKLEKIEERMGAKIDQLSEKVSALNVKQERGAGFFAGMAAVVTFCGGALIGIAKLIWG